MFDRISKLVGIVVIAVITITFVWIGAEVFTLIRTVADGARELKPNVYVPLVVTVFTAILGLSATLYTQTKSRQREIESAHRDRKLQIYLEFMQVVEDLLVSVKPEFKEKKLNQSDLSYKLIQIRTKAILWGSPKLLQALSDFGSLQSSGEAFDVLDKIQREMRKDLGLSNRGLGKDFFTLIYLRDKNELDIVKKTAAQDSSKA